MSIGVERDGVRTVGVVYDPLLDELFDATRGGGARLQRPRACASREERDLGRALLATGFAYDVHRQPRDDNLDHFARFVKQRARPCAATAAPRSISATSRRAASTASGSCKLHPWDVAAGILIVEEAGGRVSDRSGGPPPRSGRETVASNGRVHDAMLALLRG